jgi:phage tail protein X
MPRSARALGRPVAEVFIGANGGGGCRAVPARPWAEGDAAQARLLNAVVSGLRPSARARNTFFPDLVSLAAGGIAQRRASVDRRFGYDADDRHKIETVAAAVTESPSGARQLIAEVDRRAEQLVALHWCAVTALARELARRRTLDGDAIDWILRPFKVHGRTTVERDRVYEENGKSRHGRFYSAGWLHPMQAARERPMSEGQTDKSRRRDGTAGLPSTADIFGQCRDGR